MAKPPKFVTPPDRVEKWKRFWGTPRKLSPEQSEAAYDTFVEGFVPSHMEKKFHQFFGTPRAAFGNRFFRDDATYHPWETRLSNLGLVEEKAIEVTIVYAAGDDLEAHVLKGEPRRTLKDIFMDDWHAAGAILVAGEHTLYLFIEPKMKGAIVVR